MTGASSGIGRAIAETFAAQGATVLLTHRASPERAREVADAIGGRGGRALVAQADLGTREACERLVAQARDELGGLDVWVNNAGADVLTGEAAGVGVGAQARRAARGRPQGHDRLLVRGRRGHAPARSAAASIVNMSWDHVVTGMAGDDPQLFSAVKGGVLAFSKSLARRLAPDVRVNVLCPGWIETSFAEQADREFHRSVAEATPLGRWGRPQDVADAALYLASPEAAFVTGQAINVNGGVVM